MEGGASQIDTFDPKPGRPTGGPFKAIETAVAGHPDLGAPAACWRARENGSCLIRSLTSKEGNHQRARHLMHTGHAPQGGADHPALGALVAQARGQRDMPGYVSIGGPGHDAGLLGAAYSPLPVLNPAKPTRNLALARGVQPDRFAARLALWRDLQSRFRGVTRRDRSSDGQRDVGEQAIALMHARGVAAFDIAGEPAADPSGVRRHPVRRRLPDGAAARRRGRAVRGGPAARLGHPREQLPARRRAVRHPRPGDGSALLDDLASRGLLDSTLVLWMGDFGRTPTINARGGRDHFPTASSVVLAGGGVARRPGHRRDQPRRRRRSRTVPITVPDLYRSVATALGLDPDKTRFAPSGRPVKTVDGGIVIDGCSAASAGRRRCRTGRWRCRRCVRPKPPAVSGVGSVAITLHGAVDVGGDVARRGYPAGSDERRWLEAPGPRWGSSCPHSSCSRSGACEPAPAPPRPCT